MLLITIIPCTLTDVANSQGAGTGAPVTIGLGTKSLYIDNPGALSPSSCNCCLFPLSSLSLHSESVDTSRTATKHIANQIVEERVLLQELSNTLEVELQEIWKPGLWALELGAPGMGAAALAQGQSSQEPL